MYIIKNVYYFQLQCMNNNLNQIENINPILHTNNINKDLTDNFNELKNKEFACDLILIQNDEILISFIFKNINYLGFFNFLKKTIILQNK